MEAALGLATPDYTTATAIYTSGAYSKPTAECVITSPATGLAASVAKNTEVTFTTVSGQTNVVGKAYTGYNAGSTSFLFTYPVSDLQVEPTASQCYVGGLPTTSYSEQGCILGSDIAGAGTSTFTIGSNQYAATCTNRGKRTLQGFSTGAQSKMYSCSGNNVNDPTKGYANGCPYTSFLPYYNYYGTADYADKIVTAALDGVATTGMTNGNVDFTVWPASDYQARKEFAKKGTAYMHTWMYSIREYEDAIDDCTSGDLTANAGPSGPVHAWDEGVAFFVGSLLVPEDFTSANIYTLSSKGKSPYTFGNKRCQNFMTCGPNGTDAYGEAKANSDIIALANQGQYKLLIGDCAAVVPIKNQIVQKMTVPLVQGALRYAYKVSVLSDTSAKSKAEGAIFAAAVLPQVHACSATHATTIATNLAMTSTSTDFNAIKAAFEACYSSMGITCADVGGLWNAGATPPGYYNDVVGGVTYNAAPCSDASSSPSSPSTAPTSYPQIVGYSPGSQVTDHASTCPTCHAYPRTTLAILSSPASTVHHTSLLAIHPFACL